MSWDLDKEPLRAVAGLGLGCSRFGSLTGGADERRVENSRQYGTEPRGALLRHGRHLRAG